MSLPQVTIREANENDLTQLCDLLHILFSIEADFKSDFAKQEKGLKLLLRSPTSCILVAESDKNTVGMCTGQLLVSTAEGGFSVLVEDVVVHPHIQHMGIGTLLLKGMEQFAQKYGATRSQLLADTNNTKALDFYNARNWNKTQLVCLSKKH
ncbi:GNAT family N-acetyltransferase [Halodesulfovibrio aestuarii]|uniref:Ribosomal protein S18 acetylase RimI n=1 Tax=Halodesulfovibrio aestuarii TaxID=126333 RepID=A0A8G2F9S8_9BACT|nr:GNAT family N-acetyltransferase [Halodesulfovibrio aestuarii]SHI62667.1 Ribosomal protein S18 acetylase RimI [Halodesulfovibrio aestuarii]